MSDSLHGYWMLIRIWGGLGLLYIVLWFTASDFNVTEHITVAIVAVCMLVYEFTQRAIILYLRGQRK